MFEPITVVLQFGFLALLYLFLLWVVRSTAKDLRSARNSKDDGDLHSQVHKAVSLRRAAETGQRSEKERRATGKLVVLKGRGLKRNATFEIGDEVTLGRASACQIRLDDPYASHRHARVRASGASMYVEDLESTNGTYLKGARIRGPVELKPGDCIRIGDTELRYER